MSRHDFTITGITVLLRVTLFFICIYQWKIDIFEFSPSVYFSESLRNLYQRLYIVLPSLPNLIWHPQQKKKKRADSNSRNHWHIQSEVLIRSLLGWASSCILLESLFLCTSLRYLGTGVTQMPDRKDRWVKPLESSPGSSSDCSLSPQAFSSTKCQMCHRFSSHCLKRFGYVPPLPSLIFLVNYSK